MYRKYAWLKNRREYEKSLGNSEALLSLIPSTYGVSGRYLQSRALRLILRGNNTVTHIPVEIGCNDTEGALIIK